MAPVDALRMERGSAIRDEWVQLGAEIARLEARRLALMAERFDILLEQVPSGSRHHDMAFRSVPASAAGHVSQASVEGAFVNAHTLTHHLPKTASALAEGAIDFVDEFRQRLSVTRGTACRSAPCNASMVSDSGRSLRRWTLPGPLSDGTCRREHHGWTRSRM